MRKFKLYIAMSLDGYIADNSGDVSWLAGDGSAPEHPGSYFDFYNTIDTVILGYKTYDQIVTELSPDSWVYADKQSYVITHRDIEDSTNITFTDKKLSVLLDELRSVDGADIWLCGGASLVNQAIDDCLVDELAITVAPILLGSGIKLFDCLNRQDLKLLSSTSYNGFVDLRYEVKS